MNRKILTILFISFISVCLVVGFLGRAAIADDDADRTGSAYERETECVGFWCYETARQYTSEYDLMMGNIFPNITMTTMRPNYQASSPYSSSYSYEGSGVGGLFTGPMFSMPTSPMLSQLGYMGAPRTQIQQTQDPFFGSMSMSSIYQGFGGGGFMLGPYNRNTWGGGYSGGTGGYGYPGGGSSLWGGGGYNPWGGSGSLWGGGGLFGFPGLSGGLTGTGGYPTRLY